MDHYRRQGVTAEVLPLRTREDAERPELAPELARASMVFFSDGNPAYLASRCPSWRRCRTEPLPPPLGLRQEVADLLSPGPEGRRLEVGPEGPGRLLRAVQAPQQD